MEQSKPKKKISVPLVVGIAAAALIVVLVGGYFGFCAWVQGNGCLLPGTVAVDDSGEVLTDLSRLPLEDAVQQMGQHMNDRLGDRVLTIFYGDGRTAALTGELLESDPAAAVDYGMAAKDEQPFWKLGLLWLGLTEDPVQLSPSAAALTTEGEATARRLIESIARELYVAPVDFTYEVGDESVEVIPGVDGQQVDPDALFEAVRSALIAGESRLTVETESLPSAPLTGESLNELVYVEPKAAGVDESGKLSPAVIGLSVNVDEAQSILDAAVPGEPCTIPLEFTPPGTSGDEALYYHDLLASVTTNLDGVATRSFNVNRAAEFCNGKVLQPGEVFSYLGTIGDPSAANGYKTSTGYQNGLTVPMDGGGVCQMSSSLYYCAVYANLGIVKRAAHAFSTGYIPNGLDATVYYPSLDFKFRNTTGYPIKIVAYTTGGAYGQLTVQFYGSNPDGISVQTERYTTSSTAWTTVYKPDETIERGTTKVDVTPYTGYEVDVYRCVYDANGNLISRTYENHSRYAKRDKVILYNPADEGPWGPAEEPSAEPSPEVSPEPSVEPTPSVPPESAPPVQPSPTPEPVPSPTPEPVPSPTPEPVPSPTPEPVPSPTPEPTPEPSPAPAPEFSFPPAVDGETEG